MAPMPPTHTMLVDHYERKPWWVFWREPRLVRTTEIECACLMAAYYNALAEEDEAGTETLYGVPVTYEGTPIVTPRSHEALP